MRPGVTQQGLKELAKAARRPGWSARPTRDKVILCLLFVPATLLAVLIVFVLAALFFHFEGTTGT